MKQHGKTTAYQFLFLLITTGLVTVLNASPRQSTASAVETQSSGVRVWDDTSVRRHSPSEKTTGRSAGVPGDLLIKRFEAYVDFGNAIGQSGVAILDADGDGEMEWVATSSTSHFGGNDYWFVAEYDPHAGRPIIEWASPVTPAFEGITALAIHKPPALSERVILGFEDGHVEIIDLLSKQLITSVQLVDDVMSIAIGDADNDGLDEIVIVTAHLSSVGRLYLLSTTDYQVEHDLPYGGKVVVVGDIDADPMIEIVVGEGWVLELDDGQVTEQWDYSEAGFGQSLSLADVNMDGTDDIIAAHPSAVVTAYDGSLNTSLWSFNAGNGHRSFLVTDITGDQIPEVLYGYSTPTMSVFSTQTQQQMWFYNTGQSGIDSMVYADIDGDGQNEIVISSGGGSTGEDHVHIVDPTTMQKEWESEQSKPPYDAVAIGDVDNDGDDEIVFSAAESNSFDSGIIHIYDAETFQFERSSATLMMDSPFQSLLLGDPDGDGQTEIIVGSEDFFGATLFIFDGATFALENEISLGGSGSATQIAMADIDNDNQTEIVTVNANSPRVRIIDPVSEIVEWTSDLLPTPGVLDGLEIGNVDDDPALEIVLSKGAIYIIDGISHDMLQSADFGNGAIALSDVNGDGRDEVIAGRFNGAIVSIDGLSLVASTPIAACQQGKIEGLVAARFGLTDETLLVHTCQDHLEARLFAEGDPLWTGGGFRNGLDFNDRMFLTATSGVGQNVLVGTNFGVALFETDSDTDGIRDSIDNCQLTANPDQRDTNADGIGNFCDPDVNNDCVVNFLDLEIMKVNFFLAGDPDTDLDNDGLTNFADLQIVSNAFFAAPGPSGFPNACSARLAPRTENSVTTARHRR